MPKVFRTFICGSYADEQFTDTLCTWLRKRGVVPTSMNLRLRLDRDITNFGQVPMEELGEAALAVVSAAFLADKWLTQELTAFLLREKQPDGIPVRALVRTDPKEFQLLDQLKARSVDFTGGETEGFQQLEAWLSTVKPAPASLVFISHTQTDQDLAKAVADLVRGALRLERHEIRCTSVAEYQLNPLLDDYAGQLAREIREADTFLAVATERALKSTWVLFELGARWGARKHCVPLVARGGRVEELPEPVRRASVVDVSQAAQVHRLIDELAKRLDRVSRNPVEYEEPLRELTRLTQS